MRESTSLLLVISTLSAGGAERVMVDMANYLATSGWRITLVTMAGEEVEDFYPLHENVRRVCLGLSKPTCTLVDKVRFNLRRIFALRRVFRRERPGVILSFMDVTNVLTLLASRGLGARVVVSERINPALNNTIEPEWAWLRKRVYWFADVVVAQTEAAAAWVGEVCRTEAVVIPNPLRSLPEAECERENLVVSVGRLTPQKGHDVLLRAFARVYGRISGWRLVILGEGEERAALLALSRELGMQDVVELVGRVTDVEMWLARSGLVVQASRFEGFPNALLEAMGMGATVISTDCPSGPDDILEDGVNGRLVPVDDVEALATAMTELMQDESKRARLGLAAREIRETYRQDRVLARWEAVLLGRKIEN